MLGLKFITLTILKIIQVMYNRDKGNIGDHLKIFPASRSFHNSTMISSSKHRKTKCVCI